MPSTSTKPLTSATATILSGLVYGLALAFAGLIAAGGGHGTYVILGCASAPLGLAKNIPVALFGTPIWWLIVAAALSAASHPFGRAAFLTLMAAHYLTLWPILHNPEPFGDWSYARGSAFPLFIAGAIVYLLGQFAIWTRFAIR
jgi:hypothetical protein